jgi:putative heme iron utilization protein
LDDHGRPIFLISTVAKHTQNLQADPRASLLVTQQDADGEPQRGFPNAARIMSAKESGRA